MSTQDQQPLPREVEAAIQQKAKYMGECGCLYCREGHAEDLREIAALAVTHTQQAEREALEMIASPGDIKDYGWWTELARKALKRGEQ